jgi:primosomal protein N' (replication factor Y)
VAVVKPLRLKTQRVAKKVAIAPQDSIAEICVDTGVFHLPDTYDYLVPADFADLVVPGVFVKIPFGSKEVLGYVQRRKNAEDNTRTLKNITKLVSPIPLLTDELIEIIDLTCQRYACKPWDVIRSAIPSRIAAVEKEFLGISNPIPKLAKPKLSHTSTITQTYLGLPGKVSELLGSLEDQEQLLVIVPDERDIKQLLTIDFGVAAIVLSSDLAKSERYENYLKVRFNEPKLIIGTRSAVFTPLNINSKILIFNDSDESMYERRFPSWNVRDIALLRSGDFSLHFIGASPSLEIVRLTELGWIKASKEPRSATKNSCIVQFSDSKNSDISVIKAGLKKGNVLVVMAETGYINALACQKCRNQARCECGGKLYLPNRGAKITCALCEGVRNDFHCSWCEGTTIRSIAKGSTRFADELALAVPGYRVLLSKGDSRIDEISSISENVLVIASYGCEPLGEYAAVVLRSLENLTNRIDLRSLENVRRLIFENRGRLSRNDIGTMHLDMPSENALSQALLRNDVYGNSLIELSDRKDLALPPYYRIGILTGKKSAIRELARNLGGNDLFASSTIQEKQESTLGNPENSRLILRCEISRSNEFSEFFRDLARYRGIKGLSPLQLRLDPFSI